jgi:hypothetical protein
MMEDNKVAKLLVSTIIKEEVVALDFRPQEHTVKHDTFTVYRLDFMARIATPTGDKVVIIEMQKAHLLADLMRFRRYLGGQYMDKENGSRLDEKGERHPLQIYSIFFLGYELGGFPSPVLEVDYKVKDSTTGKEYDQPNEFIHSLHHKSWIIQIPYLKEYRRSKVEKLLTIFDQERRTSNSHILNVQEEDFPKEYRHIIRRLQKAFESPKIQDEMELEDDYLEELCNAERKSYKKLEEKEKVLEEKVKVIEEKVKVIEEKEKAIEEKSKVIEEQDKVIEAKEKEIVELKRLLKMQA